MVDVNQGHGWLIESKQYLEEHENFKITCCNDMVKKRTIILPYTYNQSNRIHWIINLPIKTFMQIPRVSVARSPVHE